MKNRFYKITAFICVFCFFLVSTSCTTKTEAQKKLGVDSNYFIGLILLDSGNDKAAYTKFYHCVRKGSYYCAKESAKQICEFGTIQQKIKACDYLIHRFKDSDALLSALNIFSKIKEYKKIIQYTNNINFEEDDNQIIKLRLETLKKLNNPYYEDEVFDWFTCRPISNEHYQFYRDFYEHPNFEEEDVSFTPIQFAINYRIELYKRNYTYTSEKAQFLLNYFDTKVLRPKAQLASDIGKSYLYGNMNYAANAQQCNMYAVNYKDTPIEHYFWFYAGRLYEKAGLYQAKTQSCFESAMASSTTPQQKDNAMWYLLNFTLTNSTETIISTIGKYAKEWSDASYFDDFFNNLLSTFLISGNWTSLYDTYTTIDGYASNETVAQYAYIYGRLVEEGLVSKETTNRETKFDINRAFSRALNADSATYYKILAAQRLNLSDNEFDDFVRKTGYVSYPRTEKAKAAENLLEGCALFGFPHLIYQYWADLYKEGVSTEIAFYISDFLRKCSNGNDDYLQQSLRIASKAAAYAERALTNEELYLLYPENYAKFIDEYCKTYNIPKSVMLALIRSESFFDPDVTSSAGAIGLTQLMDFTGGDIARRLRYKEYSLEDPQTNIEFGTYYLSELYRRCDNSFLQAFFSYNAGITKVRRWLQSSLIEFGKKENMPMDLFLETLPYEETREYGRKLISAGVMYEWLYNSGNLSYNEIICNLVN